MRMHKYPCNKKEINIVFKFTCVLQHDARFTLNFTFPSHEKNLVLDSWVEVAQSDICVGCFSLTYHIAG